MANLDYALEDLKICHVNCQLLVAHLDEFRLFFVGAQYHIICISNKGDRVGRRGGGVAFYLTSSLTARVLGSSDPLYCGKPEFLIAEITAESGTGLLLAVVYRLPHCGYLAEFFDVFADMSALYKHAIIFGDFNADLGTLTYDSRQIFDYVERYNLHLVPFEATYHTRDSATWLDICLADDCDRVVAYGQHDVNFLSAHDLIYITYKIGVMREKRRTILARDFRGFETANFLRDLEALNWGEVFENDNIDSKVEIFNRLLLSTFDKHAPERTIELKNLPAPWINADIKRNMRSRDLARRRWKKCRCTSCYDGFRKLRNEVQVQVRNAKKNFYFGLLWQELLIERLRKLNFSCSALRWLCSYLDNKCQVVRDPSDRRSSSFINVDIGVPQGSVLGPLLFLLFVSDLGPVLRHVKCNFYADDLMIYMDCDPSHLAEAIRDLNEDIDNIWRWAVANGLRLNPSKTKAIILGTSRFINAIHGGNVPQIVVGGEVIPYSDSVVYLGLTITNNLSWEKHVNVMVGRIHALYRFKLFKEVLPQCARKSLVAALILPLFDYCCAAICDVTGEQNVRLQRAMNIVDIGDSPAV
ncbi:hypothetical protein DMN91_003150 [Ooceraea biroi]|uniref:Reverse transcriptase domain-containing protein n=1 Tax=Ooceraea biroi TaxID=2015173 RepID=A0A3L8DZ26_OOCBI|nr:hypothetical protein DMN91_003150 [Ooceraea biroi]